MTDSKLNWITLDVASLPAIVQEDYRLYKAKYAEMKQARETFEATLRKAKQRPGQRLAINYNFGKLSVAWAADDTAAAKPAKGSVSFADL